MAVTEVQVVPDLLTYIGLGATVVAALLSLAAVVYTGVQSRKTEERIRRERRIDFELDLLGQLANNMAAGLQGGLGQVIALVGPDSPVDDLPILRVEFDRYPTAAGRTLKAATPPERMHEALREELRAAIDRRLAAR